MLRTSAIKSLSLATCQLLFIVVTAPAQTPDASPPLQSIHAYISDGWNKLSRSLTDCATYADPKLTAAPQLYLPYGFSEPATLKALESSCGLHVANLPEDASRIGRPGVAALQPPGLLYLEHPYVVPGGRFNEMYGWDSYFILLGLLRDHRLDLAQAMVDNFLFEVDHYGAILNANRTYYLTRSQPPFLTSMILALYVEQGRAGHRDAAWLAHAYALAVEDHDFWTVAPHLAGATGLSRYYDFGDGPAPESIQDETGHYRDVAAYFLARPEISAGLIALAPPQKTDKPDRSNAGRSYSLHACDSSLPVAATRCATAADLTLTPDFYRGDRSMRESGFDISFRFGAYGSRTHHFAPVCLNSLLYKSEKDLESISTMLGRPADAAKWKQVAEQRKTNIQKYLWDTQRGMFFDYDFEKQKRSSYEYATTFYPLWAGLATTQQAQALAKHIHVFERPGGLVMSPYETGAQWDLPYAWAPAQLLADQGLRRYGFAKDADRLAYEFLSMVAENFRRDGVLVEKYNAVLRSTDTLVASGYRINVVGFGWTNGVFLELLSHLPAEQIRKLDAEQTTAAIPPPAKTAGGTQNDARPANNEWTLTWSDEFNGPNGSAPDPSKWVLMSGGNGWGNDELEYYTTRLENAHIQNGNLVIEARKEKFTGADGVTRDFTSARLNTQGLFAQQYGRFEARIKIPSGQGMWPAFWMLGDDIQQVGWPRSGEIDIMENVGSGPWTVVGSLHGPGYSGAAPLHGSYILSNLNVADNYHVFAVEWEPEQIRFYVDDHLYETQTPDNRPTGTRWVFDHPFFLILNLAVGGYWPGPPDDTTQFPKQMLVDYVRVYARK